MSGRSSPRALPARPHRRRSATIISATWPPSAATPPVVKLGRLELTGFLGWLFWSLVHIYFLIEVRDRFIVAFTWLWDYVTFQRGARLITQVPPAERR